MMAAVQMPVRQKDSPWMEFYRAAERRRRGTVWQRAARLKNELREPLDALLFISVIFAWAVVLAWVF